MVKDYNKNYFLDRKFKYEKNHGIFIHELMFTELNNRLLGQCNVALNDLQRQLDEEIARAKAEEHRIEVKAHDELGKVYNFINPSSTAYEDALASTEPLKYTELAHVDGDFLAENGQKDLNTAYNRTMTVLTDTFNGFKNKQISKSDLEKVYNANKLTDVSFDRIINSDLDPEYSKTFAPLIEDGDGMIVEANYTDYLGTAIVDTTRNIIGILGNQFNLNNIKIEVDHDILKVVEDNNPNFKDSYKNIINSLVNAYNMTIATYSQVLEKSDELDGKTAGLMHKQQALEKRIQALESEGAK